MIAETNDLLANVGKLIGGAVVAGGAGWAIITRWLRGNKVDDARAQADVASLQAYDGTIAMLRQSVDQIRADKEAADAKWRQDMAQLEDRLRMMSAQVDAAVDRAREAETKSDRLRAQLRAANLEPCV